MRRKGYALIAIPITLALGATAASAAVGWHASGAHTVSATAGTWLTAPATFTLTASCSGNSGTGTATAAWSAVTGATGYKVLWGTNPALAGATITATTTSPYAGITVGSVTHHAPEYAEVEATTGATTGPATAIKSVTC